MKHKPTILTISAPVAALAIAMQMASPAAEPKPSPFAQPTPAQLAAAGLDKFAIAADSVRVDVTPPVFDNSSTKITNPLFPISQLHSAILNGKVEGAIFRVETTLLPQTRVQIGRAHV